MGLMDKARAAATDLAAKADTAMRPGASGGDADRYFRDLGVLTFLEASGRPAPPEDRERVMGALRDMEGRGAIGTFTLHTAAPPPPGGTAPPPPGAGTAPPPPGSGTMPAPVPQPEVSPSGQSAATTPAPPPPSWMTKDDAAT